MRREEEKRREEHEGEGGGVSKGRSTEIRGGNGEEAREN